MIDSYKILKELGASVVTLQPDGDHVIVTALVDSRIMQASIETKGIVHGLGITRWIIRRFKRELNLPEKKEMTACEFCGYQFDSHLGKYGCPDCHGDFKEG